jgi:hypothetical protein
MTQRCWPGAHVDALPEPFQGDATTSPVGENFDKHFRGHVGSLSTRRRFREERHKANRHEVVEQLHPVPSTDTANQRYALRKASEHGPHLFDNFPRVSHQQVQCALMRMLSGSCHGGVYEPASRDFHLAPPFGRLIRVSP